jgi:hypothetical protein
MCFSGAAGSLAYDRIARLCLAQSEPISILRTIGSCGLIALIASANRSASAALLVGVNAMRATLSKSGFLVPNVQSLREYRASCSSDIHDLVSISSARKPWKPGSESEYGFGPAAIMLGAISGAAGTRTRDFLL